MAIDRMKALAPQRQWSAADIKTDWNTIHPFERK